jgi:low affinity Fe/Cu permease
MNDLFRRIAARVALFVGSPWTFLGSVLLIIAWAASGPFFHYSDTWQLVINTSTTIVTFLMVFLIQNTQNRDAKAFHLKLDELIKAHKGARNKMIDLDSLTDEQLKSLEEEYKRICKHGDEDEKRGAHHLTAAVRDELEEREEERETAPQR